MRLRVEAEAEAEAEAAAAWAAETDATPNEAIAGNASGENVEMHE